jgi:hypothetical protein
VKKIVIVLILALILATGTVFAQHPGGWGVGIVGGGGWQSGGYGGYGHWGLSLKAPSLPIFWSLNAHGWGDGITVGVTGDKYIIDKSLVSDINLGWYFGVGAYAGLTFSSSPSFNVGARIPVGLSWQPLDFLEVFLDIAPSLGVAINPFHFPAVGFPVELGIRFWF